MAKQMMFRVDSRPSIILLIAVCAMYTQSSGYRMNDTFLSNERKLFRYLMEDYEKSVRPVAHESDTLTVELDMEITAIEDLDEMTQALYTNGWLRVLWTDVQMQWNAEDFGGIDSVRIPSSEIWTPDIVATNSLNAENSMPLTQTLAVAVSDGTVMWISPISLRTHCALDLRRFPFDEQSCSIVFMSWTHHEQMVNITRWFIEDNSPKEMPTSGIKKTQKWEIIGVRSERHAMKYPCCAEAYIDITFTINLRRVSAFATHLFLAPSVALSLIIPAVFLLPPGSGDKMTMGAGVLIAHVLLLGEFISYVPSEHASMPLMGQFFLANIVLISLSLAISTVVVNMWNRAQSRLYGPPAFIQMLFLNRVLTRLLLVDFSDYADETGYHDYGGVSSPGSVEVMSDLSMDRSRGSEDRVNIVADRRIAARSDWRRLAIVIDRLFFVLFTLLVIIIGLAYIKYL